MGSGTQTTKEKGIRKRKAKDNFLSICIVGRSSATNLSLSFALPLSLSHTHTLSVSPSLAQLLFFLASQGVPFKNLPTFSCWTFQIYSFLPATRSLVGNKRPSTPQLVDTYNFNSDYDITPTRGASAFPYGTAKTAADQARVTAALVCRVTSYTAPRAVPPFRLYLT